MINVVKNLLVGNRRVQSIQLNQGVEHPLHRYHYLYFW
ncbi:hypothetical protein EDD58_10170 [Hazenella coriacea]|uniref:Uncharacterized protein n=1 Tax=Hazenella coriacea TaxID=1179467 RepID=A0A4V2UVS7_9BACL|nr:hypothetical protein EDD58_10170 [Hazenella coriacea]